MAGKYLKKKPQKKGGTAVLILAMVLFAGMVAVGGWQYYSSQKDYQKGADAYAALAQSVLTEGPVTPSTADSAAEEVPIHVEEGAQAEQAETTGAAASVQTLTVDFEQLEHINPHTVAWIHSPGTDLSYPVVQGNDNDYYLDHLLDGTVNKNGTVFVDYRNTPGFTDRNTFVYGHNMRNGTMFASLSQYGTDGYYEAHPVLRLLTPEGNFTLEVFSGYVTPGNSDIYQLTYTDDAEFEAYVQRVRLLSDFTTDVAVSAQDRIVTLSTCTYDYEDARYVLHCKLTAIS